jgi:DNA repair exonuclease SbcCD ATPase subunit
MTEFKKIVEFAVEQKMRRQHYCDRLAEHEEALKTETRLKGFAQEGRDTVARLGMATQEDINRVIEELVTQALQVVFGPQFFFQITNAIKRNQAETTFSILENGHPLDLEEESGGGMMDLVALCLRVVLWAIRSPRTAPVIILDEPLKFLDGVRLEQAGQMICKLSDMLGLQFIIVSHEDQLIESADVMYHVEKVGKVSEVTCVKSKTDDE